MTAQNDGPNYKTGYGKPPRKSQFQKGVSGNPRGRRPKIAPSRTRLQHQLDFLSISEALITVTLNGKRQTISGFEAVVWKLQQKAMSGDKHAMELYLRTKKELIDEFAEANSDITGIVQALHKARLAQPEAPDPETIKIINKLHKRTRDAA
jgi:hypothetical protein